MLTCPFTVARTLELLVTFESIKGFNVATYPENLAEESVQTALANDVSILNKKEIIFMSCFYIYKLVR